MTLHISASVRFPTRGVVRPAPQFVGILSDSLGSHRLGWRLLRLRRLVLVRHPEVASRVIDRKLANIPSIGVDLVITDNLD